MQAFRRRGRAARSPVPGSIRSILVVGLVLVAGTIGAVPAARAGLGNGRVAVRPTQALAVLADTHIAFSKPDRGSSRLGVVQAHRPLTGEQTVLPVLGDRRGAHGTEWLHVMLPGRPNGHTGWITRAGTFASATSWHIVVDTATRRVSVYRDARRVRTFVAIVGKPTTPTPHGAFFVEESLALPAGAVGAPFALALSARSDVLQEFEGGPGQIALHGLENVGGVLGTAVSHGCVRLSATAMRWLVGHIGAGAPVTIIG